MDLSYIKSLIIIILVLLFCISGYRFIKLSNKEYFVDYMNDEETYLKYYKI